jgi:ABC-type transporter Mla MlaB component
MSHSQPAPADFSVTSGRRGIRHHIAPVGDPDLATSGILERELLRVERTDARQIHLDLAGLTAIDSVGVRVLTGAEIRSRAAGARLHLGRGPDGVERVRAMAASLSGRLRAAAPAVPRR